jgi:DNA mismatch repair protein MutL
MIKVLPQELINQIAAGEVVERPASIVKELVENSLDAKAKSITVEIENGGLNSVKIIDDGCGMDRSDARLSIAQHATSKIDSLEDLYNIQSLGFRGEALASISSVSEFSLITKQTDSLSGIKISVENNKISEQEIGCPAGTSVEIRNLFYNVPARRKFLKTAVTEFNHVVDLFINYVLIHKNVSWKLVHNGKVVYQFGAVDDYKNRIFEVLGKEVADNLIEINHNGVEVKITGFIGKPQIARNNRKLQFLYVNGRCVNDFILAKKVKDAFGSFLMNNMFPVYVLFVDIDNKKVDVNVHPRKLEVRFSDPQKIYQTVYRAVADALDASQLSVKTPTFDIPVSINKFSKPSFGKQPVNGAFKFQPSRLGAVQSSKTFEFNRQIVKPVEQVVNNEKVIGQIANSYIVVETKNSIKIIDQHAASERVQYEKVQQDFVDKKLTQQRLLLPDNLGLTEVEAGVIKEKIEKLKDFGFDISELSGRAFMINAVPQVLAGKNYKEALTELIGKMIEAGESELSENNEAIDDIMKMMACKSAIKFGDKLNAEEIAALLNNLNNCKNKFSCAHGRPCVLEFSFDDLEKMFKRKNI